MSQTKPLHYGLNNCYYAVKTADGYDTPKRLRGAVGLTIDAEGDTSTFYADDTAYFVTTTNNGRSGTLEVAGMNDEALCDLLPYEMDDNGLVIEVADKQSVECALMFECKNDGNKPTRFVMYSVKFTRSSEDHGTMEESAEPDTESLEYTAIPADYVLGGLARKVVGAHCDFSTTTAEKYDAWYTSVAEPVVEGTVTPSVTISQHTATLAAEATRQLTATTVPENETVTWSTEDSDIATVADGLVTAVAAGTTNIIATITVDGENYTDSCRVTVTA